MVGKEGGRVLHRKIYRNSSLRWVARRSERYGAGRGGKKLGSQWATLRGSGRIALYNRYPPVAIIGGGAVFSDLTAGNADPVDETIWT